MTGEQEQWRVQFDAEVEFSNGGGLAVHGFRLDIPGDAITDGELADLLVRQLGLLMVGDVRISGKELLREPHKGSRGVPASGGGGARRELVDLSHRIRHGMITYPGLPAPEIGDHLTLEASRERYAPGTEFHIGRISMVANTGTYVDAPAHRYEGRHDVSGLPLPSLADLDGVVVRLTGSAHPAIARAELLPHDVRGRAVLLHTGWDRHWGTEEYGDPRHPYLTAEGAQWLAAEGAALVGIDSVNVDGTDEAAGGARPAHSTLLAAGIPVVEHLRGLAQLPPSGFRFHAAPPAVEGMGSFPVRAYAVVG